MTKTINTETNLNRPVEARPVNVPASWTFQGDDDNWVGVLEDDMTVESPDGLFYSLRCQIASKMWVAESDNGKASTEAGAPLGFEIGEDPRRAARYLTSLGFNEG